MTSNRNDPKAPKEQQADPKADEKEEKEKAKKGMPAPEPQKKKPQEQKSDGPDIGGGLYQSLKKVLAGMGPSLAWRMGPGFVLGCIKKLNPFKSTPKPPEGEIKKEMDSLKTNQSSTRAEELKSNSSHTPKPK